jgi:hypothetical protein
MRHVLPRSALLLSLAGCLSSTPAPLQVAATGPGPVVKFDVFKKPFPEVPLPNDFATRFDATSPTNRRLNASIMQANTRWERATRAELDKLTGWGTSAPVTVAFTAPLDLGVIEKRHRKDNLNFQDDAVLVLDVTASSPEKCRAVPLDLGQGNYPITLPSADVFPQDPRGHNQQHQFDEVEEDLNGNGVLDPGEDTDMDGVLDHPNTRDGKAGGAILDYYERETNTLVMKPLTPMREATTYAVVLTKRLTDVDGNPVRSPFEGINHTSQTKDLAELGGCLTKFGLTLDDVSFTWSFTTQSISHDYLQIRDGLYGLGPLKQVGNDFPASISKLRDLRVKTSPTTNTKILPGEQARPVFSQLMKLTGLSDSSAKIFDDHMKFIDFMAMGEINSPQFFPRNDADGHRLPYYQQVYDLTKAPRAEAVPFWLFVPINRGGRPAPVAIFIHGHGGSKFDGLALAGLMARYGIATLTIDAPSHGIGLDATTEMLIQGIFDSKGLNGLAQGLLSGRAIDVNNDGKVDPGADYWTSYVFHTRDMVRQTMVDVMQVVRTMKTFDGQTKWAYDPARTGTPGLAGDFDGDGVVDVGGSAPFHVFGGSLGGITTGVAAGVEPAFESAVGIVPGGMLSEVGSRSALGGVRNAMMLRLMGPIVYNNAGVLTALVNDAETSDATLPLHALPTLKAQDTVVLKDLTTGDYRCGAVQADGSSFEVTVPSDQGDALQFEVYAGPLAPQETTGCVIAGQTPTFVANSVDRDVTYDGVVTTAGSPLTAAQDGFGLRRGTPDLRRMLGLSQIALEAGDPFNWAPYWEGNRQLTYGTGESISTRVLLMPSIGDPGVPIATGIALSRAAGFVKFDATDPRYGKSQNDVLIDTYSIEGVSRLKHFTDASGNGVLTDLEYLSSLTGADDGFGVPRLSPPLRLPKESPLGGYSGVLFPMLEPGGKHGFATPDPSAPFDLGSLLFNVIGHYLSTSGQQYSLDKCQVDTSCSWIAPLP